MNWAQLARLGRIAPRAVRTAVADWMLFADTKSAPAFRRALRHRTGEIVELRLRALPYPFALRAQGDDPYALREVVTSREVMPLDDIAPKTILALGANIGARRRSSARSSQTLRLLRKSIMEIDQL